MSVIDFWRGEFSACGWGRIENETFDVPIESRAIGSEASDYLTLLHALLHGAADIGIVFVKPHEFRFGETSFGSSEAFARGTKPCQCLFGALRDEIALDFCR